MLNQSSTGKRTRFAIYTRYSSEMQNDLSLEAQERICREAIAERGGVVTAVYSDSAKSGWSLDRDGFNELRRAGERNKVDAVMFWKFDRLARNHEHAVMIKMLLRHEYGIKLYCVEGFSEDDDDSPYSAMMEQLLAVISAFYSKNLSTETKRGKKQRAIKGEFNGSVAPIGYILVTKNKATEDQPAGLYIDPTIAPIIAEAFHRFSTEKYSTLDIAIWLNEQPAINELRKGRRPIGKETVRDMLANRVYTGRVPYCETIYNGSLGQGKRSSRKRKQWFEGRHDSIITDELFDKCQTARTKLTKHRTNPSVVRTYVLHNKVYCSRCVANRPTNIQDSNYGKMRPAWNKRRDEGNYRCLARDRGYHSCEQGYVTANILDEQVSHYLSTLTIPVGVRDRIEAAVRNRVENAETLKKMEEIQEIVKRVDFSWEQGFMTPEEYIEKRNQLQRELEALKPLEHDELIEAADLLENFSTYWKACATVENPTEARQQLIAKVVDKIFVYDDQVIGIALYGNFGVVLDESIWTPNRILDGVRSEMKKGANELISACTQNGSDGIRTRDLHLDRVAC